MPINFWDQNEDIRVILSCSSADIFINTICPVSFLNVSLRCDRKGDFVVLCASRFIPSCNIVSSNVPSVCKMIRYSEHAVECSCITNYVEDHAFSGILELSTLTVNNASVLTYFLAEPEDSTGSIYIHIAGIYTVVAILFALTGVIHSKAKHKVEPVDSLGNDISDSVENYLYSNFIDKIFDGIFSDAPFFERVLCVLYRKLRFVRILNISEKKAVSVIICYSLSG
jgi:hypothetical protein